MAKQKRSIAWVNSQEIKLKESIKRYNNEIAKARRRKDFKDNPSALPERVNFKDLKKNINSSKELNTIIRDLGRANKNTLQVVRNKEGTKSTKYELKNLNLKVNRINRERIKIKDEIGLELNQRSKINFKEISQTNFNKLKKGITNQSNINYISDSFNQYRINYFSALINEGYSQEIVDEIIETTSNLSNRQFIRLSINNPFLQTKFVYDIMELEERTASIKENWLKEIASLNE